MRNFDIKPTDGVKIFAYLAKERKFERNENVQFPDSQDFEKLPDFRTGRDVP